MSYYFICWPFFFIYALGLVNDKSFQLEQELQSTLNQAKQNIWKQMQPDEPMWNMPPYLGTLFLSEYYFELKALNLTNDLAFTTKFNQTYFTEKLIGSQLADGSWAQIVDLNKKQGSLDATIFNYWYLKDVGLEVSSQTMKLARKFILNHGGIQQSQIMTRYKLAAFGQYQWHLLPYIPMFIFKNYFPFSILYMKDYVGQWVYPHLLGLAYLRYHKTIYPVSKVCLSELRTSRSTFCEEELPKSPGIQGFRPISSDSDVQLLLSEAKQIKGSKGLFGAYTVSTLMILMSFKDYSMRYSSQSLTEQFTEFTKFYHSTLNQSLTFIEDLYFNRRVPYQGTLDDGRYWDTILAAIALVEAGEPVDKISPTVQHLIKYAVQPSGGIPYGLEFQYAPDIDDTSMLLFLYGFMNKHQLASESGSQPKVKVNYTNQINRTYTWLKSHQNSDGGFPAFDKDKNDGQFKLIKMIFKMTKIDKSAEIFDPSCPDIVGHLLEGLANSKSPQSLDQQDYRLINAAVEYLHDSRKDGMWSARWGINYIYAVGSVLPGLARIGYNINQTWILDTVRRLQTLQQSDGGFGEDSESYNQDQYVQGVSTATMTAWGLLAMLETAQYLQNQPIDINKGIVRAVQYLLQNFKQNGRARFEDRSVVGTGHRGVLNLQYPIYAYAFPTIALARARSYLTGSKSSNQKNINQKMNRYYVKQYDGRFFKVQSQSSEIQSALNSSQNTFNSDHEFSDSSVINGSNQYQVELL